MKLAAGHDSSALLGSKDAGDIDMSVSTTTSTTEGNGTQNSIVGIDVGSKVEYRLAAIFNLDYFGGRAIEAKRRIGIGIITGAAKI